MFDQEKLYDWVKEKVTALASQQIFIVEIVFRRVNVTSFLEVFLDKDEGYISVNEVKKIGNYLRSEIDKDEGLSYFLGSNLKLEVSSPGEKRSLLLDRQYKKNIGRLIKVFYSKDESNDIIIGHLRKIDDQVLVLECVSKNKKKKMTKIREIKKCFVQSAQVEFEVKKSKRKSPEH